MSVAVTVVIAPSRCLRCLLAGFGASLLAAAAAVGFATSPGFAAAPAVAAVLLFAGLCVLHVALRAATVHRIDISGPGQLRMTVQQGVRQDKCESMLARLSTGSTLWPRVLLLCFEPAAQGPADAAGARLRRWRRRLVPVAVLPDSLPPEAMRALAVALGACGGAAGGSSMEHEIL